MRLDGTQEEDTYPCVAQLLFASAVLCVGKCDGH